MRDSPAPRARSREPGPEARAQGRRRSAVQALRFGLWAPGAGLLLACYPTTTRPAFLPMPTASIAEVELGIPQATRAVAVAFDADSIPIRRTEAKDGWLESDWFDAVTLRPTTRRRLGPDVVKVRVWIDPSRPNYSNITAETVYRPLADPSRADRELEQEVPVNHPVSARVLIILGQLTRQYGGVAIDTTKTVKPDTATKRPLKKPVANP